MEPCPLLFGSYPPHHSIHPFPKSQPIYYYRRRRCLHWPVFRPKSLRLPLNLLRRHPRLQLRHDLLKNTFLFFFRYFRDHKWFRHLPSYYIHLASVDSATIRSILWTDLVSTISRTCSGAATFRVPLKPMLVRRALWVARDLWTWITIKFHYLG